MKTANELTTAPEQYYLELDSHLEELMATPGWQLLEKSLKDERLNALEIGIYDTERGKEFYQGYLRAIEFLLELPARIRQGAKEIREEQQAEDNLEARRRIQLREYQGGGEVA
ncbi:MAG: hypothetical protein ACREJF_06975 [Candidatus Methylomirabilales bacterium]